MSFFFSVVVVNDSVYKDLKQKKKKKLKLNKTQTVKFTRYMFVYEGKIMSKLNPNGDNFYQGPVYRIQNDCF